MIIINIIGGLGNQMFQYALGRSLSLLHNIEFKMDIQDFNGYFHDYNLNQLNIVSNICSNEERDAFKGKFDRDKKWIKFKNFFKTYYNRSIIKEKYVQFDPLILGVKSGYFQGYWQSERYFQNIKEIIRDDFKFISMPNDQNKNTIQAIEQYNSVSLHIRRGDYITNPVFNQVHGTMPLTYYHEAIRYIVRKVDNPHFYVFSDDPEWAETNLHIKFPAYYIAHNKGKQSFEDMRLMSCCKHNIIANSTFSWWGAWLNNNPEKVVIAPTKWFNKTAHKTDDLIPQEWIRI